MSSSKDKRDSGTGRALMVGSAILFGGGLLLVLLYTGAHLQSIGVGLLTALAALVAGSLIGFLFGIPKVVSSGSLRHTTGERQLRHTSSYVVAVSENDPETSQTTTALAVDPVGDAPSPVQFSPSSNLAEVSDWLTKLLLGAGLVSLTQLGKPLSHLVDTVARGVDGVPLGAAPTSAAVVLSAALLITFFVTGFLDGYVVTTLWYGGELAHLERAVQS